MAKQTTTNLFERAQGVRGELAVGANTATRIGQLLLDILASTAFEFDPNRAYTPGEYIIWDGRNVKCLLPTLKGESPLTAAAKWEDKVIDSVEMLGPTGKNYAVLANALKGFVSKAIDDAELGGGGGSGRKATVDEMNEAQDDQAYVTPYLVGLVIQKILDVFDKEDVPTLDVVAKAGGPTAIGRTTQLLKLLGGLYLGNIPTTSDTTLPELVIDSTGKVWKRGGTNNPQPVITHGFRNFKHFEFVQGTSPVVTHGFRNIKHFEFIQGVSQNPTLKNKTPDWTIEQTGVFTKDLEADEFLYDPAQSVTLQSAFWSGATQVATPLPSWLVFDPVARRFTATITSTDQNIATPIRVTMSNANGAGDNDYFLFQVKVTAAQAYVTQQVWRGAIQYPEGETKIAWLENVWSDGRANTKYTGGGTVALELPYPDNVTFTSPANGQSDFSITVPDGALVNDVNGKLKFTFPDGRKMPDEPIIFVNKNSTINHPPVVANPTQFLTANQGSSFDIPVPVAGTFVDPDGDPLTYTVEFSADGGATYGALPSWASYNAGTNHLSGSVPLTNPGAGVTYIFRSVASDGKGGTAADPWNLLCSKPATEEILYAQYRYVRGTGSVKDLLEVQMMDTYPDQPMRYAIVLASSGTPTDGYLQYDRINGGIRNAPLNTASAGTLANKTLRFAVTRKNGALNNGQVAASEVLKYIDFTVPGSSTSGFVNIYQK